MRRKAKNSFLGTFLFAGVLIGVFIAWQFKTDTSVPSMFPIDEIEARQQLLSDFMDEQTYLQSRIVLLREDIDEAQLLIEEQTQEVNLAILDNLKDNIGLTDKKGEGLEISLDDSPLALRDGPEVTDENLVQASDIRDVVNLLFAANSDAVSVNNQRIIATSPITSVGTTILVNNSYVSPPFVVRAIGDPDIMLQRLSTQSLLPAIYDRSSTGKIQFKITKKSSLTIQIYNGDLKVDNLNLVN